MELLTKLWPISFREKKDVVTLIVHVVVYLVVSVVLTFVLGLLGKLPLFGWIFRVLSGLIGLYIFLGIVFSVLHFFKILK